MVGLVVVDHSAAALRIRLKSGKIDAFLLMQCSLLHCRLLHWCNLFKCTAWYSTVIFSTALHLTPVHPVSLFRAKLLFAQKKTLKCLLFMRVSPINDHPHICTSIKCPPISLNTVELSWTGWGGLRSVDGHQSRIGVRYFYGHQCNVSLCLWEISQNLKAGIRKEEVSKFGLILRPHNGQWSNALVDWAGWKLV